MNWTEILTEEARRNCFVRTDDLAKKYALDERVVRNTLHRYESKGLVERVAPKIYVNQFNQQFSSHDLTNVLRRQSYISLESALVERGIISQNPSSLLCVTLERPQSFNSQSISIIYRRISPDLYWGFEEKTTRYNKYLIAEPEKALLDWIYLARQEGLPTPLDEFHLQFLSASKLRAYARQFPSTVNNVVRDLLLDKALLPENAPSQRRLA